MAGNLGIPVRRAEQPKNSMLSYPFSGQDKGGPREYAAHEGNREFTCIVRSDGMGGYMFRDPRTGSEMCGKSHDAAGNLLAEKQVNLFLAQVDKSAWNLESRDRELDIIRRERELIDFFRRQGHDDPIKSTAARLALEEKVWDEAVAEGVKPSDWVDAKMRGVDPASLKSQKTYDGGPLAQSVGAPQETGVAQGRKGK